MQAIRLIGFLVVALGSVLFGRAASLRVSAAASLADALQEIVPAFTRASGHTVALNFGGSGMLARQIRSGAPADVFISADAIRVDELEHAGLVVAGTRRILVCNQLVLVARIDDDGNITSFADLVAPGVKRIAIGEPATVPAGTYAKIHLESLGLWARVTPKLVPLDNVRAVLAAVAAGNVGAGIVYRTDALIEQRVRIVESVAVADGPPIVYPAVVLRDAAAPDAARALLEFLAGAEARTVFLRFGFLAPASDS